MSARQFSPIEKIAYTPEFLAAARHFSKIQNGRAAFTVARQWFVISIAIAAAVYTANPFVYVASFIVIATRQQALAALMHEGSHYRLFSNHTVNDFVASLFCGLPIGLSVARYGDEHIRHHRAPNTGEDPYWLIFQKNPRAWNWPKSRGKAIVLLLRDVTGLNTFSNAREVASWTPWPNHFSRRAYPLPLPRMERVLLYLLYPAAALVLTLFHGWLWFLALWILPTLSLTQLLVRIRAVSEHTALRVASGTEATRHVDAHWLEKLTICSFNINYHLTHHVFPQVVYYNLPKMHALLCQNPEFRRLAQSSPTYLGKGGVLRHELTRAA